MLHNAELLELDHYPSTQLVGFFTKRLYRRHTQKNFLVVRLTTSFAMFGFLAFGVPTIVGLITEDFLFDNWEIVLAFAWLAVGALLIDLLEYSIDKFWIDYRKISIMSIVDFNKFKMRMSKKIYSKKYFILSIFFYVVFFAFMKDVLYEHGLIVVVMVDILMILAALMWGAVGYVFLCMPSFMKEVCSQEVKVNPFHPDGFGGLSGIGNLSIRVAALVSSGSLYIPHGINRFSIFGTSLVGIFAIICVAGMSIAVIAAFYFPLKPLKQLAERKRNQMLESAGIKLKLKLEEFEGKNIRKENDLEILITLESYREIRAMKVWPFNFETILNLLGMILLPILLFLTGAFL